jgi:hypothetical protein
MYKTIRIQLTINDQDWQSALNEGLKSQDILWNIEQQLEGNMGLLIRKVDLVDHANVIEFED